MHAMIVLAEIFGRTEDIADGLNMVASGLWAIAVAIVIAAVLLRAGNDRSE